MHLYRPSLAEHSGWPCLCSSEEPGGLSVSSSVPSARVKLPCSCLRSQECSPAFCFWDEEHLDCAVLHSDSAAAWLNAVHSECTGSNDEVPTSSAMAVGQAAVNLLAAGSPSKSGKLGLTFSMSLSRTYTGMPEPL